jgi:hypothetical protein
MCFPIASVDKEGMVTTTGGGRLVCLDTQDEKMKGTKTKNLIPEYYHGMRFYTRFIWKAIF